MKSRIQVTVTGHSLGGQQAQEMLTTLSSASGQLGMEFRGIGFNATGIGQWEANSEIDYVQVNVVGDLVERGGFGEHGVSEVEIDLGHGSFSIDAHDMSKLAFALQLSGEQGSLTFEQMNTGVDAPSLDLSEHRPRLDAFLSDYGDMVETGRELEAVNQRIADLKSGDWRRTSPIENDPGYQRLIEYKEYLSARYGELEVRVSEQYESLHGERDLTIDGSQPWPNTEMEISPFTEAGEVNIDYILSLDTAENRQAFLESQANPEFAGILTIEAMQAQQDAAYYRFLKEEALNEVVLETGLDYADIVDLDVPGNPNAPGYYPEIPNTALSDLLASDNDAQNAGFAGFGASQQEADNPGSTGWQADNPWDTANGNAPWSPEEEAWHQNLSNDLEVGYSAYELYRAVEHGDFAEQLSAGFDMVQDLDQALNGTVPEGATAQYEGLHDLSTSNTAAGLVSLEAPAGTREPLVVQSVVEQEASMIRAYHEFPLAKAQRELSTGSHFVAGVPQSRISMRTRTTVLQQAT